MGRRPESEAWDRRLRADPEDREAARQRLLDRSRRGEPADPLAPLRDLSSWDASEAQQDLAIEEVDRRLGDDFQHIATEVFERGGQRHRIATFYHLWTRIELQLIPGEEGLAPFLIGRFPLRCVEARPYFWSAASGRDFLPFVGHDLREMAYGLEQADGDFRLPFDDEWLRAAAAGTDTPYYWGRDPDFAALVCAENSSGEPADPTERIAQANAFGLVDVLGNVREAVQHRASPVDLTVLRNFEWAELRGWIDNHRAPEVGDFIGLCGGSARDAAAECRVRPVHLHPWWEVEVSPMLWGIRLARDIL